MKSGHYQPGKHCFAFLLVRDASVWFAGQESRLNRQRRFNRDENKEDHLSLVAAIKAAYLEMTSARTPAHRERVNRAFFSPSFFPCSLFCPKETHGKLPEMPKAAGSQTPNSSPRVSLTCSCRTK